MNQLKRSGATWVVMSLMLGGIGCAGSRAEAQSASSMPAGAPEQEPAAPEKRELSAVDLGPSAADGSPTEGSGSTADAPAPPSAQKPMRDIEARFRIETENVKAAIGKLHGLVEARGGYVVQESISTDQFTAPGAELTLRVPARGVEQFFAQLEALGTVRARNVESKDVGKEYFDAETRLSTLEQSKKRYDELLGQARTVEETMAVEARLEDVRQRIESLKGELRWLKDRAAQATVHVSLFSPESVESPYEEPEATFYPGLRMSYARNVGGSYGASDFVGPGLSIRFSRHFSIDVEGLPSVNRGYGGEDFDLFLATLGGEIYSEFLGGGKRQFLNPYLGARAGYARFLGLDQVAVGAVLGLEVYKTPIFTLDLETRSYLLFSSSDEAHALIQPGLSFNVAF